MSTERPEHALTMNAALEIFTTLAGLGYGVAVKHQQGRCYVEVPVTLRGDPAYGKQAEIMSLALRGGFTAVQTGPTLRIVGK